MNTRVDFFKLDPILCLLLVSRFKHQHSFLLKDIESSQFFNKWLDTH
jgi:hypothetical protein